MCNAFKKWSKLGENLEESFEEDKYDGLHWNKHKED